MPPAGVMLSPVAPGVRGLPASARRLRPSIRGAITVVGSSGSHVEGGVAGAAALRGLPRRARLVPRRLGRDTRCFGGGGSYGDFDEPDFSMANLISRSCSS